MKFKIGDRVSTNRRGEGFVVRDGKDGIVVEAITGHLTTISAEYFNEVEMIQEYDITKPDKCQDINCDNCSKKHMRTLCADIGRMEYNQMLYNLGVIE